MNEAEMIAKALREYPFKVADDHPTDQRLYLHGVQGVIVDGKAVVVPDWQFKITITNKAPLPRKEVISIQLDEAMSTVNEIIVIAKEAYQESIKKCNTVRCCDITRNIKDLAGILTHLEVYREQVKDED